MSINPYDSKAIIDSIPPNPTPTPQSIPPIMVDLETMLQKPMRDFLEKWADKSSPAKMLSMEKDLVACVTVEYKDAYLAGYRRLPPAFGTFTVDEFNEKLRGLLK